MQKKAGLIYMLWSLDVIWVWTTEVCLNLVSLCIRRWVERVELRLKHFPHSLHSNSFSALWMALKRESVREPTILPPCCPSDLCWFRLISWPKVLLHSSQAKGLETVMRPTFSTFSKMVLLKNILILVSKLSCFHCDFSARELLQKQTFRVLLKLYLQQF